jgi:hypothetical protein
MGTVRLDFLADSAAKNALEPGTIAAACDPVRN